MTKISTFINSSRTIVLISIIILSSVLLFIFNEKKKSSINLFKDSVSLWEEELAIAIFNDDRNFLVKFSKGSFNILDDIRIFNTNNLIFSYPEVFKTSSCYFEVSFPVNKYGLEIGRVKGCLTFKRILSNGNISPTLILFILSTAILSYFLTLLPLICYKKSILEVMEKLEVWSENPELELNSTDQDKKILSDTIGKKLFTFVENGVSGRLENQEMKNQITSSEAIQKMAQQVSHDIKSPLVALKMATQNIDSLPEDIRLIIRGSVRRIEDIANLLSIKKQNEKEDHVRKNEVTLLSSLIEDIVTEKRMQYRSKLDVTIESNLDSASYGLFSKINRRETKRVISNIINNSVEAFNNGGLVEICLSAQNGKNRIIIKDNGKGIPKEYLDKVFKRGETFGKATGSGLGLSHAKETIENLGGEINIDSMKGIGTEVIIDIPAVQAPDWLVPEILLQKNSTIAILDDDSSIHNVWNEKFKEVDLKSLNIKIINLSSSKEFEKWKSTHKIDDRTILLSDFELIGSKETGLDLIEKYDLQKQSILITSHYENIDIKQRCKKLGLKLIPKLLASIVPLKEVEKVDDPYNVVHCDDDKYLRMSWKITLKDPDLKLLSIASPEEFECFKNQVSNDALFYIDQELGENSPKGLQWAKELHIKGYKNIFLSTGYPESYFKEENTQCLKGFVSKDAPWS